MVRHPDGKAVLKKEFGQYTCFHIAHEDAWKKHLYKQEKETVDEIWEGIEGVKDDALVVLQPPGKKRCK